MKFAGYVKPAATPNPVHHVPRGPRMNHHDALRKVDLACGVLPEESIDQPMLSEEIPGDFSSEEIPADEVGLLPGFDGPSTLLSEEGPTEPIFSETAPYFPGGGSPISTAPFTSPIGGGTPSGGGPGGGTPGGPVTPVPEPGSFVLLLSGLAGAGGVVRRRFIA